MSSLFHFAKEYRDKGLSFIPLKENSKFAAIKWKKYQSRQPTLGEAVNWFAHGTRRNIAIVTGAVSGVVVLDFDTKESASLFWKEVAQTTAINVTRKGLHFLFQHPGEPVRNGVGVRKGTDIRGDGGIFVAPPSQVDGHQYHWLSGFELGEVKDLPVFNPDWIPKGEMKTARVEPRAYDTVRSYVLKIESVQGEGGSRGLVRAAAKCRDAGLTESEATALLLEWNQSSVVNPPWSIPELTRAVSRIYAKRQEETTC
jgi:hypothetical protein